MSITFAWSVKKLEVVPVLGDKINVVITVNWNVIGTDGDISESHSGLRSFSLGESFVPYDQLTEQQVLDWCFEPELAEVKNFEGVVLSSATLNLKEDAEEKVTKEIERRITQKSIEPALPWVALN
jgi:hypothetical protein